MGDGRRTVLITGASSGIGLAAAQRFADAGWNVAATMRDPGSRETPLHADDRVTLVHLDVCDATSVRTALEQAIALGGGLDAIVNNAGYALSGPFEGATTEQIIRQFDTNVFGAMELTRAVLPHFRSRGAGLIINISSMGGRMGFPLYSLYNSTKWAIEGFSEALHYELEPLGIRVKIIEPGVIRTDFYGRSNVPVRYGSPGGAYDDIVRRAARTEERAMTRGSDPHVVADAIVRAASDGSKRLRYPVGSDATAMTVARRMLPERLFFKVIESQVLE